MPTPATRPRAQTPSATTTPTTTPTIARVCQTAQRHASLGGARSGRQPSTARTERATPQPDAAPAAEEQAVPWQTRHRRPGNVEARRRHAAARTATTAKYRPMSPTDFLAVPWGGGGGGAVEGRDVVSRFAARGGHTLAPCIQAAHTCSAAGLAAWAVAAVPRGPPCRGGKHTMPSIARQGCALRAAAVRRFPAVRLCAATHMV